MAIGRGRFERKILEKSPRKGRKKVSKKKASKKDIQSAISGLFGGTGGGRGEPKELPESINIPGIGKIELPKAKPKSKTKSKKVDQKLIDNFNQSALGKSGDGKVSFDPSTGKYTLDAFGAKKTYSADEFSKAIATKKKDTSTPINTTKGKIREREDIRVPTREDIDKIIKDLDIKIPEVINIPGMGQVTIPTAPKPPVEAPTEKPIVAPPMTGGPVRTSDDTKGGIFGRLPDLSNLSELDKLKQRFETLASQRFIKDPGPEHYQAIKDLGDQIFALDKNFKSDYYTPGDQSAPTPPTAPTAPKDRFAGTLTQEQIKDLFEKDLMDYDDDYFYDKEGIFGDKGLSYKKGVPEDVVDQIAADVNKAANQAKMAPPTVATQPPVEVGREPAPDLPPAPEPPTRVDTTPQPAPPPPPQLINVDPFKGFKDSYRPANIVGQSFDPSVRDDYEKQMQAARAAMMQPGGNIRATEYPTYQTPTLAVPQTQFGGYGQPMPISPLLPYAGLASATRPEQVTRQREPASGARVNPGTGQIEPVGMAPDPGLVNLPPGVIGPIR